MDFHSKVILKFILIFCLVLAFHSLVYFSILVLQAYLLFSSHSEWYDIVVVNAVPYLDNDDIMHKLHLEGIRVTLLNGDLWSLSLVGFSIIKCNTLIIIGHGCNNAIATNTRADILNYIIHGPLGILGFTSTMYIPFEDKRYIALTLNFFKYLFNPHTKRVIIVSCDVEKLAKTLSQKGYIVYTTTNLKILNRIIHG